MRASAVCCHCSEAAACTHCTPRLCCYGCQDFACERCLWMRMQLLTRVGLSHARTANAGKQSSITIACNDGPWAQGSLAWRPRTLHRTDACFLILPLVIPSVTSSRARRARKSLPAVIWCWELACSCVARGSLEIRRAPAHKRSQRNSLADARFRQYKPCPLGRQPSQPWP